MLLLRGDCLQLMAQVPAQSVDMVCCDLPYGATRCAWDTPIDLAALWRQYERIAKPSAAIVLFAQTPFDKVLGCSKLEWLRYELVWEKPNATGFLNAKKAPLRAHENILVFYRKAPTYNPQKTDGHPRKVTSRDSVRSPCYGSASARTTYDSTSRYPRSVLKFSSDKQRLRKLHPTQKPVLLIKWLIRTYSNEGDTVLDNCMGCGTTGVACAEEGRKFIGMELDPAYFETAQRRLSAPTF